MIHLCRAKYLLVVRPREINRRDSFPGLTRERVRIARERADNLWNLL